MRQSTIRTNIKRCKFTHFYFYDRTHITHFFLCVTDIPAQTSNYNVGQTIYPTTKIQKLKSKKTLKTIRTGVTES